MKGGESPPPHPYPPSPPSLSRSLSRFSSSRSICPQHRAVGKGEEGSVGRGGGGGGSRRSFESFTVPVPTLSPSVPLHSQPCCVCFSERRNRRHIVAKVAPARLSVRCLAFRSTVIREARSGRVAWGPFALLLLLFFAITARIAGVDKRARSWRT